MRPTLSFTLLAIALLGAACRPAPLRADRFRTLQSQTAFERTVAAVETTCGGVHRADPKLGSIVSAWWDAAR